MNLNEIENYLDGVSWHGDYISACCVFHDDENPSMLVFENGFKCLACGKKGNLQELFSKISGHEIIPRSTYKTKSKTPWGKWLSARSVQELCWDAHQCLKRNPSQGVYLKERGIDGAIDELKLGWLEGYYFFHMSFLKL